MINDDEYLERVVAGIQSYTTSGADVSWNEDINGRQFDVVVRFTLGKLRYLVLIEVKNRTRRALASDMDAFVTKSRDQNANKSVFVTAAGFQQGAIEVAKRHGVDIFTVKFDDTNPRIPSDLNGFIIRKPGAPPLTKPIITIGEPQLTANIDLAKLFFADGSHCVLPDERSEMTYYCINSRLSDGRSLSDLLEAAPFDDIRLDETREFSIPVLPQQRIDPPDTYYFLSKTLERIDATVTGRNARPIRGNMALDPNSFSYEAIYTNILTGEQSRFRLDQLPLGSKRVSVGNFYFIPTPLLYYFCQSIHGDDVVWHLVESFQNGKIISGTFRQSILQSFRYIPVTDKKLVRRLKWRLDAYRAASC